MHVRWQDISVYSKECLRLKKPRASSRMSLTWYCDHFWTKPKSGGRSVKASVARGSHLTDSGTWAKYATSSHMSTTLHLNKYIMLFGAAGGVFALSSRQDWRYLTKSKWSEIMHSGIILTIVVSWCSVASTSRCTCPVSVIYWSSESYDNIATSSIARGHFWDGFLPSEVYYQYV